MVMEENDKNGTGDRIHDEKIHKATRLPPEIEKQKVKADMEKHSDWKKWKLGMPFYVIKAKWWTLWKEYVRYDVQEEDDLETDGIVQYGQRPGEIDNEDLLEPEDKESEGEDSNSNDPSGEESQESQSRSDSHSDARRLKSGISKGIDYETVTETVWLHFMEWYGGGPEIRRVVTYVGVYRVIDLWPICLHVWRNGDTAPSRSLLCMRTAPMKTIKHNICSMYFSPPGKHDLYLVNDDELTLIDDLTKTPEELGLRDGQQILLKANDPSLSDTPASHSTQIAASTVNIVYSPSRSETTKEGNTEFLGVTGLYNLGNTCFMNSILQCLSNTKSLREYFLKGVYTKELNTQNTLGTKGEVTTQFGILLNEIWSGKYDYVNASSFKKAVGRFAPQFNGYEQHDAQELLAFLLDGLHEDLNRVHNKLNGEANDQTDLEGEEAWKLHLQRNQSLIVDLFQGQLKSTLKCGKCNQTSIKFDPFMYLSLPIPTSPFRIIHVHYFPHLGKPTKYGVRVSKTGDVHDLKRALVQLINLSPEEIILADVYGCRPFPLPDYKYLLDIRASDVIYGYQVVSTSSNSYVHTNVNTNVNTERDSNDNPTQMDMSPRGSMDISDEDTSPMEGDTLEQSTHNSSNDDDGQVLDLTSSQDILIGTTVNLTVLHRKVTKYSKDSYRAEVVAYPIMMSYVYGMTTYKQLQEVLVAKLNSYLQISLSEDSLDLRIVNLSGKRCGECSQSQCLGCPIPESDRLVKLDSKLVSLSIDWTAEDLDSMEDILQNIFALHESLELTPEEQRMKHVALEDCLKLFTTEENLTSDNQWLCPKCKEWNQALKKLDIWKLPEILIVHLKRFQYNTLFRDKLNEMVHFPVDEFDMAPFVANTHQSSCTYELFAVSNHMGGLGGGHYTCYAKNQEAGKWFSFNDSSCTVIGELQIVSKDAYILFYQRKVAAHFDWMDADTPFIGEEPLKQELQEMTVAQADSITAGDGLGLKVAGNNMYMDRVSEDLSVPTDCESDHEATNHHHTNSPLKRPRNEGTKAETDISEDDDDYNIRIKDVWKLMPAVKTTMQSHSQRDENRDECDAAANGDTEDIEIQESHEDDKMQSLLFAAANVRTDQFDEVIACDFCGAPFLGDYSEHLAMCKEYRLKCEEDNVKLSDYPLVPEMSYIN